MAEIGDLLEIILDRLCVCEVMKFIENQFQREVQQFVAWTALWGDSHNICELKIICIGLVNNILLADLEV